MSLSSKSDTARGPETAASHSAPTPKRRRLNLACNYCRSRKTRCDEQKPSCHACLAAGLACITTDPRKPNRPVERRKAGKDGKAPDSTLSIEPVQTPEQGIPLQHTVSNTSPESASTAATDGVSVEGLHARVGEEHQQPADDNDNAHNNVVGQTFRGLLPILKHEVSSTGIDILTGWLNVASFRLGLGQRFGLRSPRASDQYHNMFPTPAPPVIEHPESLTRVANYFQNVHPIYPILDKEGVYATLNRLQSNDILTLVSIPEYLPHVVSALVVLDLGSDGNTTAESDRHGIYAFLKDLLGRLIGRPTLLKIKALFLLALDMYYHDDLASVWSTLTLCISMATAVGLGRSRNVLTADVTYSKEDGMRIWWSIVILENLVAFETGRRSSVSVLSANALAGYDRRTAQERPEEVSFFSTIIGFAKLLGEIGTRCIDIRDREEVSGKDQIQGLVAEKVKITGESCVQLIKWAETLPDHLRPGSDLIYDRRTFPHAAFISIHYYNALLVLTRNSLLISETALRDTTEVISKNQPWGYVIRNGQPMVASTARKLVKLFIEAGESGTTLLLPHTNASLHALYVLAVHLMRQPDTMLRKTDLDLIKSAAYFAKNRMRAGSSSMQRLCSVLSDLDKILEHGTYSDLGARMSANTTPSRPHSVYPPESDALNQSLPSGGSDISMYTLPDTEGSSTEEFLGRIPELDDYNNDYLYYYGMEIGTWIGLDSMRWDAA
ncbi:hypothetical protein OPT61_g658 [Boeremia exigua]|uniref:Uncharacterized protein n=1 Tax=Boeremia exigua TaxID=749465 RepID=A0ACC2IT59_9PLEO|nr:hypothetical protein OPT61_g658 [Boeremia exigua]